jgi:hypothetical protein
MNLQVSWIFNVLAKMVYRRSINFLENKHLFKVFLCVELLMINFSFLSFSAICCVKLSFPSCLFFYPLWRETRFNLWDKVPGSDMVLPFLLTAAMFCAAAASLKGVVDEVDRADQAVQAVSDHRMLTCWLLWIQSWHK